MKEQRLALIGRGGLAQTIADLAIAARFGKIVALLDDSPEALGMTAFGATVEGSFGDLVSIARKASLDAVLLAIGGIRHMLVRGAYFSRIDALGLKSAPLIHPSAVLGSRATVGSGSVVGAGVVLGPEVVVGEACVVYAGAVVEHESVLETNVYVSPGVLFGGRVRVGRNSYLGIGAKIADHVNIGEGSIVGAGALVLRDVPPGVLCYGSPAKVVSANRHYRSVP